MGYAQNWNLSVQRDLPYAMVVIANYLGTKGTRSQQQFLPNTFPQGAANPCPACPAGYAYLTSNGNSTRHAAQSNCAAVCGADSPPACNTRSRSPSTMPRSAGEIRAAR